MKLKKLVTFLVLLFFLSSCQLRASYTLRLEPQKLTIKQGGTATLNVSYDYQSGLGFLGPNPTKVSLENPPRGVQADPVELHKILAPTPMTITVASDAALGTFQMNVIQVYVDEVDRAVLELTIVAAD